MLIPNKSMTDASATAQANANRTGEPWAIFYDASGNLRIERYRHDSSSYDPVKVVRPDAKSDD